RHAGLAVRRGRQLRLRPHPRRRRTPRVRPAEGDRQAARTDTAVSDDVRPNAEDDEAHRRTGEDGPRPLQAHKVARAFPSRTRVRAWGRGPGSGGPPGPERCLAGATVAPSTDP